MLFADIVGFTGLSSGMDAAELVTLLNDVFSVFDGLVAESGLEKIKTIGDAYMVVGGMPDRQPDHLERMASLALRIAAEVGRTEAARRLGVQFRIGMHCGAGGRRRHRDEEVHLRRLGRHSQCRQPDGIDRRTGADPGDWRRRASLTGSIHS